jgi:dienelactone hydrolase
MSTFTFAGKTISVESYGEDLNRPILILLHGSGGPDAPMYRQQARFFADSGYNVLLMHFFDAASSRVPSSDNYRMWGAAVGELVRQCKGRAPGSHRKVGLLGFSLGASVALTVASQRADIDAVVDWYGSLPDESFYRLRGMPPLLILHGALDNNIPVINARQLIRLCEIERFTCDNHIYPDQGHGFQGKALEDADGRTLRFLAQNLQ